MREAEFGMRKVKVGRLNEALLIVSGNWLLVAGLSLPHTRCHRFLMSGVGYLSDTRCQVSGVRKQMTAGKIRCVSIALKPDT